MPNIVSIVFMVQGVRAREERVQIVVHVAISITIQSRPGRAVCSYSWAVVSHSAVRKREVSRNREHQKASDYYWQYSLQTIL